MGITKQSCLRKFVIWGRKPQNHVNILIYYMVFIYPVWKWFLPGLITSVFTRCQYLTLKGTVNFVSRESQCFPRRSHGRETLRFGVICYEKRAEIPATTPGHRGQHFAGNSDLFPVWRHSFCNLARSLAWHLVGNSFIVSVIWTT